MAVYPATTSDRTEPPEEPERTCGNCWLFKPVACEGSCAREFYLMARLPADELREAMDEAELHAVAAEWEACPMWRPSRWA